MRKDLILQQLDSDRIYRKKFVSNSAIRIDYIPKTLMPERSSSLVKANASWFRYHFSASTCRVSRIPQRSPHAFSCSRRPAKSHRFQRQSGDIPPHIVMSRPGHLTLRQHIAVLDLYCSFYFLNVWYPLPDLPDYAFSSIRKSCYGWRPCFPRRIYPHRGCTGQA